MTIRWCILGALFAALALACGDEEPSPPGGSGGQGGGAGGGEGTGGTGGSGGAPELPEDGPDTGWAPEVPAAIHEPLEAAPRPETCGDEFGYVAKVRGWIAAPGGAPLSGGYAQFCVYAATGEYVCLNPAIADEAGVYTIDVPKAYRCVEEVAMRTIKYVEHPEANRAIAYCPVTTVEDPVLRLEAPSVLPLIMRTEELPPLGDEGAVRPVALQDGLSLQVRPSGLAGGGMSYEELSGRRIPTDAVGLCGGAEEFDGLYAFHPEDQ